MIVALAGRRIDVPNADPRRFPWENIEPVRGRLRELFSIKGATALVCSAACGADLLALEVAGSLGMRRRIVLPFSVEDFRETSVVDRPGDWGPLYDRVCDEVWVQGDLVLLGFSTDDEAAYSAANSAIMREAEGLQAEAKADEDRPILPVIVWEGASRGDDDLTAAFGREAETRGFLPVESVLTK